MRRTHTLVLMALAMGVILPMPEAKSIVDRASTLEDKERIEAARLKQERKAKKRLRT